MKKFVFCIMTALLLISCIPVGAFADGIQKTSVSEDGGSEGIFTVDYYMDPELSEFSLGYGTQTTPDGEMIWYPRYHSWGVMAMRADYTSGLNVDILPVKVLDENGRGDSASVASGIYYVIDQGADVISFSATAAENSYSEPVDEAITAALEKGIIFVAAAGNENMDTESICPVHRDDIIVTAAMDEEYNNMYIEQEGAAAIASNHGSSMDVTAPGVDVKVYVPLWKDTDGDGFGMSQGTAMASSHVSAAAAILKLLYPDASPAQAEDMIKSCARDLGDRGKDDIFGAGLPIISDWITSVPFEDVHKGDWFYDVVLDAYRNGYMTGTGYPKKYFNPVSYLERQDAALLLYRIDGTPQVSYRNIYPDVNGGDYFADAAVWAYNSGVMTGNSGKLGVCSDIYRQDLTLILFRYANYKGCDTSARGDLSAYTDSAWTSEYAWEAMEWAVGVGIIGQSVENLNPLGYVNRAEAAAMISRFTDLYDL